MREELEAHKEKIVTCVLFSWKNNKNEEIGCFGPTFLRPDDGSDLPVYAESSRELALVNLFLSVAAVTQFDRSNMTETGCYYAETMSEALPCKRNRLETSSQEAAERALAVEELKARTDLLRDETKKRRLMHRFLRDPRSDNDADAPSSQRSRYETGKEAAFSR